MHIYRCAIRDTRTCTHSNSIRSTFFCWISVRYSLHLNHLYTMLNINEMCICESVSLLGLFSRSNHFFPFSSVWHSVIRIFCVVRCSCIVYVMDECQFRLFMIIHFISNVFEAELFTIFFCPNFGEYGWYRCWWWNICIWI